MRYWICGVLVWFSLSVSGQISDTGSLRTYINTHIVPNGARSITAQNLNTVLNGYLNVWGQNLTGTTNNLAKFIGPGSLGNANATDNGQSFTIGENAVVSGFINTTGPAGGLIVSPRNDTGTAWVFYAGSSSLALFDYTSQQDRFEIIHNGPISFPHGDTIQMNGQAFYFENGTTHFDKISSGQGIFGDTLTATTMGEGDSSNRVASTAWIKQLHGISTGTYAPYFTNIGVNVDSLDFGTCLYQRIDSMVTVDGRFHIATMDSLNGDFVFSLPFASAFRSPDDCAGIISDYSNPGNVGAIVADVPTGYARITFKPIDSHQNYVTFHLTYIIH